MHGEETARATMESITFPRRFFGPANERVNTTDGTKGKAATHVVRHVSEKRVDFIQITKNVSVIRVLWRDRGQVRVLVF